MTPPISNRARLMPASPIRKLMPLADEARRRGIHIYHLNIGQPDLETPEPMRRRLRELRDTVFAYTPSGGTPEYLATVQAYYEGLGIPLGLEDIIATTGGSEALLFAFLACANEGDEALVVEPFYTNYSAFATMAGVRLVPLTSRGEDGFHLPPRDQWEKALTKRTRMVLLCNPNNPTGTVYTSPGAGRWSRTSAASAACSSSRTRSTGSSCTTAARRSARPDPGRGARTS